MSYIENTALIKNLWRYTQAGVWWDCETCWLNIKCRAIVLHWLTDTCTYGRWHLTTVTLLSDIIATMLIYTVVTCGPLLPNNPWAGIGPMHALSLYMNLLAHASLAGGCDVTTGVWEGNIAPGDTLRMIPPWRNSSADRLSIDSVNQLTNVLMAKSCLANLALFFPTNVPAQALVLCRQQ